MTVAWLNPWFKPQEIDIIAMLKFRCYVNGPLNFFRDQLGPSQGPANLELGFTYQFDPEAGRPQF
jgi:hypothetical protein